MGTHPGRTTAEAFARGMRDGRMNENDGTEFAPVNMAGFEIGAAAAAWKVALTQHEHTSYYGADYIMRMRAYWLGRKRAYRWQHRMPYNVTR